MKMLKNTENENIITPKVSVVMPVYNAAAYLRQAMDSIVNQTLKEIEIICVDDGSTDNSREILQFYQKNDARITVLSQKNCYAGVARNNGMQRAVGKYILFLDADDVFDLEYLKEMYNRAEQTKADVVLCQCDAYDEMNQKRMWMHTVEEDYMPEKEVFSGDDISNYVFQFSMAWAWDKLFRLSFVKEHGFTFQDIRTTNDVKFVFPALAQAERITYVRKRMITHRMFNSSSLQGTLDDSWRSTLQMYDALYQELTQRNLYKKMQKSFDNFVSSNMQIMVLSLDDINTYRSMYLTLQKETIEKFRLLEHDRSYYYEVSVYDSMKKVKTDTPEEYLMANLKEYKQRLIRYDSIFYDLHEKIKAGQNKRWHFPWHLIPRGAKIIIYGAGGVGKDFYEQFQAAEYCHIVAWVDKDYRGCQEKGLPVDSIENIKTISFDYIIIAVLSEDVSIEIKEHLIEMGIDSECMVWPDLKKSS